MSAPRPDLDALVARLLEPIQGALPAGVWLRYEGVHDAIQEARREDDATLPQGVWQTSLKVADWARVESLCQQALLERSKDFQIAGWLTESWQQRYGAPGLAAGLALLTGLTGRFWAGLWPALDGKDVEARIAPVEWLDEKLTPRLALTQLTAPRLGLERPCTLREWRAAQREEQRAKAPVAPEVMTLAKCRSSAELTPEPFFRELDLALQAVLTRAGELGEALTREVGNEAPSLRRLTGATEDIRLALRELAPKAFQAAAPAAEVAAEEEPMTAKSRTEKQTGGVPSQADGQGPGAAAGGARHGAIQSRAEAYRMLQEAADYLLRTEPHSPTPYLVRRAVAWGEMPLQAVLEDLMKDSPEYQRVTELLNLAGKPEE